MAEGTTDAMLMITISWQALMRVRHLKLKDIEITDCTVIIFL